MPMMLFLILILIFVIPLVVVTNIVIVPQSMVYVVERLGSYSETWSAGKAIMNGILALVGEDNPEIAAILTAVIPQVDTMLEGFNKIEVGAKMTRK